LGVSAEQDERNETTALEIIDHQLPAPTAQSAEAAVDTYLAVQRVFDAKLPDSIMSIQGKQFRKKAYWRAIATAFKVDCVIVTVERLDEGDDWGYEATVRATSQDGRTSDGDGACMASEKHGASCTVHNVRSHAVTRAKNRAISDLVGFGEVSADELPPEAFAEREVPHAPNRPANQPRGKEASEKQRKMLFAKAMSRANEILDEAIQQNVTPAILSEKDTAHEIRRMCAERVGCGEKVLHKEVDPLIAAIAAVKLAEDGTLCFGPMAAK
jgi:hypothetical protein